MSERSKAQLAADIALAVIALGAAGVYFFGPGASSAPAPPVVVKLPEATTRTNELGERLATLDEKAWEAAHDAAGLPAPGVIADVDVVPVGVLTEAVQTWIDTKDADAIGQAGEVYLALEHHDAAIRAFAAAAALEPKNDRWLYLLGAELQAIGSIEPAIAALQKVREIEPSYPTTHARLGELQLELGDFLLAEESFEAYRKLLPNVSLGYVGLGRVALARRDLREARRQFEKAVDVTPNDFVAWRMLSRAYAGLGEQDKALEAARQSERLPIYRGWMTFDPRLEQAHRRASTQPALENELRAAMGQGPTDEVVATLKKLIDRRPRDANLVAMLARAHMDRKELDDAKRVADEAIELEPETSSHYALKAMIYITSNEYERAHIALDDAIRLDAESAPAWELRGRLYLLQRKYDDAASALAKSVELDGKALGARHMYALALAQLGQTDEAERQLETLLSMEPGYAAARQLLDVIRQQLK